MQLGSNIDLTNYSTSPYQAQRTTYRLAGQTIAVRVAGDPDGDNGLYYLHSDHLGSASSMSDTAGQRVGEITRYTPFGETRTSSGNETITDMGFTGHKHNDTVGLVYMNARFYVPSIGRFASADSIVPEHFEPQSLNRFSYTKNNPMIYVDPTGHCYESYMGDDYEDFDCLKVAQQLSHGYDVAFWALAKYDWLENASMDKIWLAFVDEMQAYLDSKHGEGVIIFDSQPENSARVKPKNSYELRKMMVSSRAFVTGVNPGHACFATVCTYVNTIGQNEINSDEVREIAIEQINYYRANEIGSLQSLTPRSNAVAFGLAENLELSIHSFLHMAVVASFDNEDPLNTVLIQVNGPAQGSGIFFTRVGEAGLLEGVSSLDDAMYKLEGFWYGIQVPTE